MSINPSIYPAAKREAEQPLFLYCFISLCYRAMFYPLSSCHRIQETLQRIRKHQDRHKGKEMTCEAEEAKVSQSEADVAYSP